jgi:hypothetical protein
MPPPLRSFSTKEGGLHVPPHKVSSPLHSKSEGRWRLSVSHLGPKASDEPCTPWFTQESPHKVGTTLHSLSSKLSLTLSICKSMDEQLSTRMDWIWSCRCLELLCTSTQSSYLKWVSGGGTNSPRHPKRCWLTTSEKVSVRWTDAILFKASVYPVPLPCHLVVEVLWQNYSDAMHRRCVGSSSAKGPLAKLSLFVSS